VIPRSAQGWESGVVSSSRSPESARPTHWYRRTRNGRAASERIYARARDGGDIGVIEMW
jgi:hypothetical protein